MSATALSATGNDRIAMGANLSPFDAIALEIEDLYGEAKNWADGTEIASDDLVGIKDALDALDDSLLKAGQKAEKLRKELVKPFDDGKAAVQEKFHPLIGDTKAGKGKVPKARDALNVLRTDINLKLKAIAEEAAAKAEAARLAEIEAFRIAREQADSSLDAAEHLEQMEASVKQATRAAKSTAKAATTGLGLRTKHVASIENFGEAARAMWGPYRARFEALVLAIAQEQVDAGRRDIPGITVRAEQKAS